METYLAECLDVKSRDYKHFGIFTTQGKVIQALRDAKKDSARITEFEIDKPNEATNSVFYVYV